MVSMLAGLPDVVWLRSWGHNTVHTGIEGEDIGHDINKNKKENNVLGTVPVIYLIANLVLIITLWSRYHYSHFLGGKQKVVRVK